MIGSDSHKSKHSALKCSNMGLKRHETFYAHYKILLLIVSYSKVISTLHVFSIEEKSTEEFLLKYFACDRF